MFDYFNELHALCKEFNGLTSLTEYTCEATVKLNDHAKLMKLMQFLSGLDQIYNHVKTHIILMDPLPQCYNCFFYNIS